MKTVSEKQKYSMDSEAKVITEFGDFYEVYVKVAGEHHNCCGCYSVYKNSQLIKRDYLWSKHTINAAYLHTAHLALKNIPDNSHCYLLSDFNYLIISLRRSSLPEKNVDVVMLLHKERERIAFLTSQYHSCRILPKLKETSDEAIREYEKYPRYAKNIIFGNV